MREALQTGFRRVHVRGWTAREAAWLIEASDATQAEHTFALPPSDAEQWIRLADVELSPRVEQRVRDFEVLVLAHSQRGLSFQDGPAPIDLVPDDDDDDAIASIEESYGWIEVAVLTAGGAPAAGVLYELVLPDGEVVRGRTDQDGLIRHNKLAHEGECEIRFPEVDED